MEDKEAQALREEIGQVATRLDNVEGYFNNFDITLSNHMSDYKKTQEKIEAEQVKTRDAVTAMGLTVAKLQGSEGIAIFMVKWVVVPLIALLAGLVGIKVAWPGIL